MSPGAALGAGTFLAGLRCLRRLPALQFSSAIVVKKGSAPTTAIWHSDGWLEAGKHYRRKMNCSNNLCPNNIRSEHDKMALETSPETAK
jgi:hypothetical protein